MNLSNLMTSALPLDHLHSENLLDPVPWQNPDNPLDPDVLQQFR
jgi:hypothetical protein